MSYPNNPRNLISNVAHFKPRSYFRVFNYRSASKSHERRIKPQLFRMRCSSLFFNANFSADGMSGPDAMSGPDDDHHTGDRMSVDDEAGKASAEEGNQCRYRRNMKKDQQDNKERAKQDGTKQQNKKDGQSRQESNEGRRDNPRNTREKSHEGNATGHRFDKDRSFSDFQFCFESFLLCVF